MFTYLNGWENIVHRSSYAMTSFLHSLSLYLFVYASISLLFFETVPLSLDVFTYIVSISLSWFDDGETTNNCVYAFIVYVFIGTFQCSGYLCAVCVYERNVKCWRWNGTDADDDDVMIWDPPKYGKLCVSCWQVCASFPWWPWTLMNERFHMSVWALHFGRFYMPIYTRWWVLCIVCLVSSTFFTILILIERCVCVIYDSSRTHYFSLWTIFTVLSLSLSSELSVLHVTVTIYVFCMAWGEYTACKWISPAGIWMLFWFSFGRTQTHTPSDWSIGRKGSLNVFHSEQKFINTLQPNTPSNTY